VIRRRGFLKKEHTDFHILKTIQADALVSQRKLSSQMELNVASVNFAMQNLVKKGFVTMTGENARRTEYYITPEGLREKTHLAYKFFGRNIPFYKEVRNDIEAKIEQAANGNGTGIAIYGANELSEIAYMVVSKMNCNFLGFFLGDSKITDEKKIDFNIQGLNSLMSDHRCLLILAETFPADRVNFLEANNVETLNLVDYIAVN
jgi:predicted transcriptional regulator